jgi:hypothetical protein
MDGICCDTLQEVFTDNTGLYISIAALMAAAAAGTIPDVTTARAWTGAEFKAIADKASKAQKASSGKR